MVEHQASVVKGQKRFRPAVHALLLAQRLDLSNPQLSYDTVQCSLQSHHPSDQHDHLPPVDQEAEAFAAAPPECPHITGYYYPQYKLMGCCYEAVISLSLAAP